MRADIPAEVTRQGQRKRAGRRQRLRTVPVTTRRLRAAGASEKKVEDLEVVRGLEMFRSGGGLPGESKPQGLAEGRVAGAWSRRQR
jgi:hypothetical protein